jgi:hypothetical protein
MLSSYSAVGETSAVGSARDRVLGARLFGGKGSQAGEDDRQPMSKLAVGSDTNSSSSTSDISGYRAGSTFFPP